MSQVRAEDQVPFYILRTPEQRRREAQVLGVSTKVGQRRLVAGPVAEADECYARFFRARAGQQRERRGCLLYTSPSPRD